MTISITEVDGRIHLIAPFNGSVPARAKLLGGRWNAGAKAWTFDPRDREKVAELAVAVYGTDGTTPVELVTLQLPIAEFSDYREVTVAGRIVLEKRDRDARPSLGTGVILLSGAFVYKSGSMRYPTIGANDAIIEIKDVPATVAAKWVGEGGVIVSQEATVDVAGLTAERERLQTRIAEIDNALAA